MNTYTRQSKPPKPQTAMQRVERFQKDMETLGYDVEVDVSTSPYKPAVTVSVWPKVQAKEAQS